MPFEHVQSFLEAMSYPKRSAYQPIKERAHAFVTISRQAGAGSHSVAKGILEEMKKEPQHPYFRGWQTFDEAMCKQVLEEARLSVSMKSLISEEFHSQVEDFVYQLLANRSPQDVIFSKTFTHIRILASIGKMIFIGRGAACVTRDMPFGIHLRLVAPLVVRVKRMASLWQTAEETARARIMELDQGRARMVRHYFGRDIDDPRLYDLIWNTERMPVPDMARLVVDMIETKEHQRNHQPLDHLASLSS